MPDDRSGALTTARPDSSKNDTQAKNPVGDVQNLLGFLLVGFGAVLSFLGLRSTEVTTVLRNDPAQTSLIVLMLLLGILSAVLTIAIDNSSERRVSWISVAGVVLALLGLGAFVIYLIPVGSAVGLLSKVLGYVFVPVGIITVLISVLMRRRFIDAMGYFLALLGVAAIIIYFTPVRRTAGLSLVRVSPIPGCVFVLLGLILLLPPRIVKGPKTARAQRKEARAEESAAKAEESAAKAEETAGRVEEVAARAEESAARVREKIARRGDKHKEKKKIALAEGKIATAQEKAARAEVKVANAQGKIDRAQEKSRSSYKWYDWQPALRVPLTVVFILASVMFIAISAYGGMRLESKSQLSFSSQAGATFSVNGSLATVSVDITATKIAQNDYVFVNVYAVPAGTPLASMCAKYVVPTQVRDYRSEQAAPLVEFYTNHCIADPCLYFFPGNDNSWPNVCNVILTGSINPNAAGDVDETLSVPFKIALYEDVDVRPEVCPTNPHEGCEGSVSGENSRLDWVISQPPKGPPTDSKTRRLQPNNGMTSSTYYYRIHGPTHCRAQIYVLFCKHSWR